MDAFAALSLVGDASCLESIAGRYAAPPDEWSKSRLADLFRAIVKREGVSRRHPVIKRIERKQKPALDELWPDAGRSRRNPSHEALVRLREPRFGLGGAVAPDAMA